MKHIPTFFLGFILSISAFTQNYNAEVLEYKTKIVYKGNKVIKTTHISLQIKNSDGLEYANISIPFSGMGEISGIDAYISNADGKKIKKLKKKDLVLRNRFTKMSFHTNNLIYEFKLIHNEFPYIINYSYISEREEFVDIAHWYTNLFSKIPTRYSELKLIVNDSNAIDIREVNISLDSKSLLENNEIEYTWVSTENQPKRSETLCPHYSQLIPNVLIIPKKFKYQIDGSLESWQSFGSFVSQLNSGLGDLPFDEKTKITELITDIDDKKEMISVLFDYLKSETRYVNISINEGGLKTYPASYVSENKFGDCKALSNYFKSILGFVGIQSYYTLISSGDKINKVQMDFPSQQFNHVILFVPLENDNLWVDCTSDYKCEYVGTFIQDRNAFIINKDQSYFKKTPALTKEDVKTKRTIFIKDTPSKNAEIKIRNSYKGAVFEHLYYIKNHKNNTDMLKYLQKNFVEEKLKAPDEFVFQIIEDENEIILDYNTTSNTIINYFGNEMILNIPRIDFPDFELPKYRDFKVQIDYPIYHVDQITFEIPQNSSIETKLINDTISSEYGYYQVNMNINNNLLIINKEFYLIAKDYDLDQYEEFYDFVKKSRTADKKLIVSISKN